MASALATLLALLERQSGLTISVDDYGGIFDSLDALRLPIDFHRHHSALCDRVKQTEAGLNTCVGNKSRAVSVLNRRRRQMCGMCRLGLTEIVEPILYHGRTVAALYYGPFVVTETLDASKDRLRLFAKATDQPLRSLTGAHAAVPRVEGSRVPQVRRDAAECKQVIEGFIAALNPPLLRNDGSNTFQDLATYPDLVRHAMRLVYENPTSAWSVKELSNRINCHPNHLGSTFGRVTGMKLTGFIHMVRVDRAKSLLRRDRRFSIADVALMCGYDQVSHFTRVFKAVAGVTPGQYVEHASQIDGPA